MFSFKCQPKNNRTTSGDRGNRLAWLQTMLVSRYMFICLYMCIVHLLNVSRNWTPKGLAGSSAPGSSSPALDVLVGVVLEPCNGMLVGPAVVVLALPEAAIAASAVALAAAVSVAVLAAIATFVLVGGP